MSYRKEEGSRQREHKPMGGCRPTNATYTVTSDGRVVNYQRSAPAQSDGPRVVIVIIVMIVSAACFLLTVIPPMVGLPGITA